MAKVIRIGKTYELGDVLADIEMSGESDITLQISSDSKFLENTKDLQVVRTYAESLQKTLKVENTERFEKVGFVAGADISQDDVVAPKPVIKPSKKSSIPKMKLKLPKVRSFVFIIVAFLLLIAGIAGYSVLAKNVPKATVTLTVSPEIFTGTKEVNAKEDPGDNDVKLYKTTTEITESKKAIPTGEKEVGDKATGEIEVLNKSGDDVKINSGTEVTINFNGEDLVFLTNEKATVDKKTEEDVTNSKGETVKADVYGKKKIEIIASKPGEKYNLSNNDINSSDISLDINKDKISAELSSSTSGGTSKTVTVVSEKDLTDLKESLQTEIEKKAKDKLEAQTSNKSQLLDGSFDYKTVSADYSAKVDEEASEVTLTSTVEVTAYYLDGEEIKSKLSDEIEKLVPENYKVSEGADNISVSTSVKDIVTDNLGNIQSVVVSVKVEAFVIPNIDKEKIANDIKGLSKTDAEKTISKINNIKKAEFVQKPAGVFTNTLPKRADNITIEIKSEKL